MRHEAAVPWALPPKHVTFFTDGTGNAHLDRQISTVSTLMRIASSQVEFDDYFEKAFPPSQARLLLKVEIGPDKYLGYEENEGSRVPAFDRPGVTPGAPK